LPGQKVKLQINGVMRSYTPATVDPEQGCMEVIIFLHGQGPAARWAAGLKGGEETVVMGPKPSMKGAPAKVDWVIFLGDESALGLGLAMLSTLPANTRVSGAVELALDDAPAIAGLGLSLDAAVRTQQHGEALLDWLRSADLPAGQGAVWVSGEAGSVMALRDALLDRGLQREQILIKPYWSLLGHAHRKRLERAS
jgi:NADPH-dependent ferric siderophore reductase